MASGQSSPRAEAGCLRIKKNYKSRLNYDRKWPSKLLDISPVRKRIGFTNWENSDANPVIFFSSEALALA
jgi:hypothetical protein